MQRLAMHRCSWSGISSIPRHVAISKRRDLGEALEELQEQATKQRDSIMADGTSFNYHRLTFLAIPTSYQYNNNAVAEVLSKWSQSNATSTSQSHLIGTMVNSTGSSDVNGCVSVTWNVPVADDISVCSFHLRPNERHLPKAVGRWHHASDNVEAEMERGDTASERDGAWLENVLKLKGKAPVSSAPSPFDMPAPLTDLAAKAEAKFGGLAQARPSFLVAGGVAAAYGLRYLKDTFPKSLMVGLHSAHTPFVNGLETTLFHNQNVHSHGVVGFGLLPNSESCKTTLTLAAHKTLGAPMRITRVQGNVVLEVDGLGDARALLDHITQGTITLTKDCRIYAKIYPLLPDATSETIQGTQEEALGIFEVTSGDPSRGSLSLNTITDVVPGQFIQLITFSDKSNSNIDSSYEQLVQTSPHGISFASCGEDESITLMNDKANDTPIMFSENGCIHGGFIYST